MKNNRKYILFLVGILVILLVIGITYAWLTQTVIGEKVHSMRVGTFKFSLSEENSLTLDSGEFMSDDKGMSQDGFKFTVENTGVGYGNYSVYLDDDTFSSNRTRIDDKFIRYSLGVNSDTVGTPTNLTSRKLYSGTLGSKEKDTFVLRVWLNKDVNGDIGGQVFKSKIRIEVDQTVPTPVAEKLLAGVGDKGSIDKTDPEQTFITGESPNNYIWYSGKLWRAVSIDPTDNSVKLITQWNITALPYSTTDNVFFDSSYAKNWLNDTSADGFLGNLREPEKFIKTNSVWNTTTLTSLTKPAKTNLVTVAVGLLNSYEYNHSYLFNGTYNWLISPRNDTKIWANSAGGNFYADSPRGASGIRPSINLNSSIKIVGGTGTKTDPYRLKGDNDKPQNILLSTRYSGEYIRFGTGENNLYRIVSHENGTGTKVVSAIPLKNNDGTYKKLSFDKNSNSYSANTDLGTFLNGEFLNTYFTASQLSMIGENSNWYLGTVGEGGDYNNAKETTVTAKVGLLRIGELMSGQFNSYNNNSSFWLLTNINNSAVWRISEYGGTYTNVVSDETYGVKPSFNLKSNVIITGGKGTKEEPFVISLNK